MMTTEELCALVKGKVRDNPGRFVVSCKEALALVAAIEAKAKPAPAPVKESKGKPKAKA